MQKLTDLLNLPKENTFLSKGVFTTGYHNVGGGYPARIVSYNATTKTIRLVALQDHDYDEGWIADKYVVGDNIYIYTGYVDYNPYQVKKIAAVTRNETVTTSGGVTYTHLNSIDIELDSPIILYSDDEGTVSTTTFDPAYIFYRFGANALEDITNRPMSKLTLTASSLGCAPGTQVQVFCEGTQITRLTQSWSGETLTIQFTDSYANTPNKQFYMTSVNGVAIPTYVAVVKDFEFGYTVNINGEYNFGTGANSTLNGNGLFNVGDFTVSSGIHNFSCCMNGDISGTSNMIGEGSDITVKGGSNAARGRNISIVGNNCISVTDGNTLVGGLIEAYTMNNVLLGNNIRAYPSGVISGSGFGVGDQITLIGYDSAAIGRDLLIRADNAVIIGQYGELPEYDGNLSPVTEVYASGEQEGIHYRGAFAMASGMGPAQATNKRRASVIFSKYKWKKNPAYPYGTGDSATVCPNVVGAGAGITAAKLRSTTTEDPIKLEDYPLLTIDANLNINGVVIAAKVKEFNCTGVEESYTCSLNSADAMIFVVKCGTAPVYLDADESWVNGIWVRMIVFNGGTSLVFDESWKAANTIPALQTVGMDIFEVCKVYQYTIYRHLGAVDLTNG